MLILIYTGIVLRTDLLQTRLFPLSSVPMLKRLSKKMRIRATVAMVVAYAFCLLAPHLVMAMTNGAASAHCLTEPMNMGHVHQASATVEHIHADGAKHVHQTPAAAKPGDHHGKSDKNADGNCCGLFCITAMSGDGVAVLPAPPAVGFDGPLPQPQQTSLDPDQLIEPPIA